MQKNKRLAILINHGFKVIESENRYRLVKGKNIIDVYIEGQNVVTFMDAHDMFSANDIRTIDMFVSDTQVDVNRNFKEFNKRSHEESEKRKLEALDMQSKGLTVYDISKKLNVTIGTVYGYLRA